MGFKDHPDLSEAIMRDIRHSLGMSSALFPSEEQIREYWRSKGVERERKEEERP
jgi:uncharacterized protein YneF (UPF0154 family)